MQHVKRIRPLLIFVVCLLLASCGDASLKTIAQAELDVANGVTTAQKTVEQLYASNQITADDARAVSTILLKITTANQSARAITQNLVTLDPSNRQNLKDIVIPLVQAVNDGIAQSVITIKDPNARSSVMAVLATVVTSLNIIQTTLSQPVPAK
jgi:hypothetical protein